MKPNAFPGSGALARFPVVFVVNSRARGCTILGLLGEQRHYKAADNARRRESLVFAFEVFEGVAEMSAYLLNLELACTMYVEAGK